MLPLARPVAAQKRIAATRFLCGEVSQLFGGYQRSIYLRFGMQDKDREPSGRSRSASRDRIVTLFKVSHAELW
jgi:hypothetical protein